jgi:hypothetical protein
MKIIFEYKPTRTYIYLLHVKPFIKHDKTASDFFITPKEKDFILSIIKNKNVALLNIQPKQNLIYYLFISYLSQKVLQGEHIEIEYKNDNNN